jgi:hypothetical protein
VSEAGKRGTMRAELKPDCYGGETCDQIIPRWWCYCDGDKDGDYERGPLQLMANFYPPGTVVNVIEPTCPDCGELREPKGTPGGAISFADNCRCGFDWKCWTLTKYS